MIRHPVSGAGISAYMSFFSIQAPSVHHRAIWAGEEADMRPEFGLEEAEAEAAAPLAETDPLGDADEPPEEEAPLWPPLSHCVNGQVELLSIERVG